MVTRRTTQRQYLLRPDRDIRQAFRYCLARAVQKSGVLLHAVVVMSNHYHIICTDPLGKLPVFTEELNKMVGRCLNNYHDRSENFWASGVQPSQVTLENEEDVLAETVYAIVNPVEAGLVRSHQEWPGELLFQPGRYQAKRPTFFFRQGRGKRTLPEKLELELVAPPIDSDPRVALRLVQDMVRAKERAIRAEFKQSGRAFLGAARIKARQPTDSPKTLAPRRLLSPKLAGKTKSVRIELIARFKLFVEEYRAARGRWLDGIRTVLFPPGTYAMRVRHAVRCADA